MEKAIKGGDLRKVGELAEQDTLELHSITMTGDEQARDNESRHHQDNHQGEGAAVEQRRSLLLDADGPSVFINTNEEDEDKVRRAISHMGYKTILSGVGKGGEDRPRRRSQRLISNPRYHGRVSHAREAEHAREGSISTSSRRRRKASRRRSRDALDIYMELWERVIKNGTVSEDDEIDVALSKIDKAGGLYEAAG